MNFSYSEFLKVMVFLVSSLMFINQISESTHNLMYPQVADSSENILIQDISKPLITICPHDQVNESKVKELGFSDYYKSSSLGFFLGRKKDKGITKLSWGLDMNKTYEELLEYVLDGDVDLAVSMLKDGKFYNKKYNKDLKKRFYIGFWGFCWELEDYDITSILTITSWSGKHLEVYVTDKNIKSFYSLNIDSQFGPKIVSSKNKDTIWYVVDVMMKYNEDPRTSENCVHYEKDEFENCVDKKVQNWIKPEIGCNPPWLSKIDKCKAKLTSKTLSYDRIAKQIIFHEDQTFENLCPKPCTEMQYRARIRMTGPDRNIKLSFNSKVQYSGKMLTYNHFNFLIDVGSSLGLWFGVSVFGLTDLGIQTFNFLKNKVFIK